MTTVGCTFAVGNDATLSYLEGQVSEPADGEWFDIQVDAVPIDVRITLRIPSGKEE